MLFALLGPVTNPRVFLDVVSEDDEREFLAFGAAVVKCGPALPSAWLEPPLPRCFLLDFFFPSSRNTTIQVTQLSLSVMFHDVTQVIVTWGHVQLLRRLSVQAPHTGELNSKHLGREVSVLKIPLSLSFYYTKYCRCMNNGTHDC